LIAIGNQNIQHTVKIFPRFLGFKMKILDRKKKFFKMVPHLVLIYTPKEAHRRIFVTAGSVFARQMLAKKSFSWRGELVST
tara:strand:- start:232 stop:474 length:243 start_codon:yes stop_codon:yes gene_type:complete